MTSVLALFLEAGVEWVWTATAVFGVGVCMWALVDSYSDRFTLVRNHENGDALKMIRMNLRASRASLVLHTFFLVLGVVALETPDKPEDVVIILIFGISYILVAGANVRAVLLNQIERFGIRKRARGGK